MILETAAFRIEEKQGEIREFKKIRRRHIPP